MGKRRTFHDRDNLVELRIPDKFKREREMPPLRALTENQGKYLKALATSNQVVVMGPAGTGKTHIAGTHAADKLRRNEVSKVYLTRPNVPGGRTLGHFKGTMEEKIAPWAVPLTETMRERMSPGAFDTAMGRSIEIVPFEVMRGRTFRDCIVILDEAQNTTKDEMKMFLTRIGEGAQVIINGDISQSDLKEASGLKIMLRLIAKDELPVPLIEFTLDDIVRSGVCEMWVRSFHAAGL